MNKIKEIIIVADPMCSWCWGFEPVIQTLQKKISPKIKLSLLLGGLRSKGDQAWTDEFKAFLQEHWKHVEAKTGQKFNTDILEKEVFEYDTEPACRAVVTLREMDDTKQFLLLNTLQEAFYLHGVDITQESVLSALVKDLSIDEEEFLTLFRSKEMIEKTQADVYKSRSMGANVFPSVVIIDEEGHLCVLKGYKDYEELSKLL